MKVICECCLRTMGSVGWLAVELFLVLVIGFSSVGGEPRRWSNQARFGVGNGEGGGGSVGRPSLPLIGEDQGRKARKNTDCNFGSKTYELEEVWHPDLGPPFHVMYCVRCECMAVKKKRRIAGRVRCKNIKDECPKPSCDHPVLLPGQCCKVCAGDAERDGNALEEIYSNLPDTVDIEKHQNEFAALLSGRGANPQVFTRGAGRATFTLHRRNIHFVIHFIGIGQPTQIRFYDDKGDIMEEQELDLQQTANSWICGVWRKLPKVYRKLLHEEKVHVALITESYPEGIVAGVLAKYQPLSTETLSSLLLVDDTQAVIGPAHTGGGGAMAIISTNSNSGGLHIFLLLNGVFSALDIHDVPVNIKLEMLTNATLHRRTVVVNETIRIGKPNHSGLNVIELKAELSPQEVLPLIHGQLSVTCGNAQLRLGGIVSPKRSCNVFQTILAKNGEGMIANNAGSSVDGLTVESLTPIVGMAILSINDNATFSFKVNLQGLSNAVSNITIEAVNKKKRRIIQDITTAFLDDWANGTITLSTIREFESLQAGDVYINVVGKNRDIELRGKFTEKLYSEAHAGGLPLLLTPESLATLTTQGLARPNMLGLAWLSVDKSCKLYYEVTMQPLAGTLPFNAHMSRKDGDVYNDAYLVELVDFSPYPSRRILQEFNGLEVEDYSDDLTQMTLSRLDLGVTYLQVSRNVSVPGNGKQTADHMISQVQLKARITNVPVPSNCLPQSNVVLDAMMLNGGRFGINGEMYNLAGVQEDENGNVINTAPIWCWYENRLFDDGAQWMPENEPCIACSCQRGKVVCDPVVCPRLNCANARKLPGQCCPSCTDDVTELDNKLGHQQPISGCYFEGDKRFYAAGTSWHPYIPPFGFSTCATCTCDAKTLKVECSRLTCPPLSCPDFEAIRDPPQACCKKCPTPSTSSPEQAKKDEFNDEGQEKNDAYLLAEGGCQFRGQVFGNGEEWNPRVQPFGEMKCIRCTCKDGRAKCKRQKCPQLQCKVKIEDDDQCCPKCADNSVVSMQALSKMAAKKGVKKRKPKIQQSTPRTPT